MAGHSKWANIKHRKARQDKKRGKIFTRAIREVTIAAREGGGDPDMNPRLRLAMDKANAVNVPKDNIERAIARGTGDLEGEELVEVRYEGYGPNGVAIMVDCMTDNKNRTVAEVRHAFSKHGGNLGADGSVAYLFSRCGVLSYEADTDEDAVLMTALEAGAEDLAENDDGSFDVITAPEDYEKVNKALLDAGLKPAESDITMRPASYTDLDAEQADTCLSLLEALEDLDDVQEVYTNAEFPEELEAA